MVLSHSFAKFYDVLVIIFLILHFTLNAHSFWWHKVCQNRYAMFNITPSIGMPKDVNDQLRSATGLNPDDPNDMAFKLVTILNFYVCHKNSLFSSKSTKCSPSPPPCIGLSTNAAPPCVPL